MHGRDGGGDGLCGTGARPPAGPPPARRAADRDGIEQPQPRPDAARPGAPVGRRGRAVRLRAPRGQRRGVPGAAGGRIGRHRSATARRAAAGCSTSRAPSVSAATPTRARWYHAVTALPAGTAYGLTERDAARRCRQRGWCRARAATRRRRCSRSRRWSRRASSPATSSSMRSRACPARARRPASARTSPRSTTASRRTASSRTGTRPRSSRSWRRGHVRAAPGAARPRHPRDDLRARAGRARRRTHRRDLPGRVRRAPFVRLRGGDLPVIKHVAHTNFCDIGWKLDAATGRLVVVSCLDNLLKGAAGQAVQNFNVAFGFDERAGPAVKAATLLKLGGELLEQPERLARAGRDAGARRRAHAPGGRARRRARDRRGAGARRHREAAGRRPARDRRGRRWASSSRCSPARSTRGLWPPSLPPAGARSADGRRRRGRGRREGGAAHGRRRRRSTSGLVGEPIDDGTPALLRDLMAAGYLPVVAASAWAADGTLFNVNADTMAATWPRGSGAAAGDCGCDAGRARRARPHDAAPGSRRRRGAGAVRHRERRHDRQAAGLPWRRSRPAWRKSCWWMDARRRRSRPLLERRPADHAGVACTRMVA